MTTEGTQTGEFMGIPASGKKISITEMNMVRIANGKAVERWGQANAMAMMRQLGVIPEQ
jgi:predicted ester cyclase